MRKAFDEAAKNENGKRPLWGLMAYIARDLASFCDRMVLENAAFYEIEDIEEMARKLYPRDTPNMDASHLLTQYKENSHV